MRKDIKLIKMKIFPIKYGAEWKEIISIQFFFLLNFIVFIEIKSFLLYNNTRKVNPKWKKMY